MDNRHEAIEDRVRVAEVHHGNRHGVYNQGKNLCDAIYMGTPTLDDQRGGDE